MSGITFVFRIYHFSVKNLKTFFVSQVFYYICTIVNCKNSMTNRDLIVECAMKMFVTQGVKAVRMNDIAQELGISKRTLYEIFDDKEELLYQSIKLFVAQGLERRAKQIKEMNNEMEIMIISLRDMINDAPTISRLRRNVARFYPNVYTRLEQELTDESNNNLTQWIKKCIDKGFLTTTADSEFVVKVLNNSAMGIFSSDTYDSYNSVEIVSMMSYSMVIFIRGLCTTKGMEVIDNCFDRYFSNIPAPDTFSLR